MRRLVTLIFIAALVFVIILFIQRPELLEDVWIWLIGLVGPIFEGSRRLFAFFEEKLSPDPAPPVIQNGQTPPGQPAPPVQPVVNQPTETNPSALPPTAPAFDGITLTVLRYSDDGETTVGLLYVNGKFYCYTLEDTYQAVKVAGKTRIPAGTYALDFNRQDTALTLKYRERYPEWFYYHLHIKEVPGFQGIYIHNGGTHADTEGCLLVSDSLAMSGGSTVLNNSRNTFKRLYQFLEPELHQHAPVRIIIKDESWFQEHYA